MALIRPSLVRENLHKIQRQLIESRKRLYLNPRPKQHPSLITSLALRKIPLVRERKETPRSVIPKSQRTETTLIEIGEGNIREEDFGREKEEGNGGGGGKDEEEGDGEGI